MVINILLKRNNTIKMTNVKYFRKTSRLFFRQNCYQYELDFFSELIKQLYLKKCSTNNFHVLQEKIQFHDSEPRNKKLLINNLLQRINITEIVEKRKIFIHLTKSFSRCNDPPQRHAHFDMKLNLAILSVSAVVIVVVLRIEHPLYSDT